MPINLFNDPLASIKLGADNILKGYIGNNEIFPNTPSQTNLTVQFVNNTGLYAMDASSYTVTGVPGQAITEIVYGLRSTSAQRIDALPSSESGDTGNNLTIASSFPTGNIPEGLSYGYYRVNGTFPNTDKTIVYTLSGSIQAGSPYGPDPSGVYTSPSVNASVRISSTAPQYSAISSYLSYSIGQPPINSTPFTTNRTVSATMTHDGSSQAYPLYSQPDSFQYTGNGSPGFGIGVGTSSVSVSLLKNSGYYITGSNSTTWLNIS